MIELTLPWPPSVNTYWRMFKNRMIISEAGRKYRVAVGEQVLLQTRGKARTNGPVKVTIEAWKPDNRRRDLDNLLKAVLDSLGHAGVYIDDSLIVDLRIYWAPEIGGMLKVKVEELNEQKDSVGN
jgi:crossover junction endodeoxyribonuclease RusA